MATTQYNTIPPPPPIPPLPPNYHAQQEQESYISPPHFEDPLVAPRPTKAQPDLPADMARSLDVQVGNTPGGLPVPNNAPDYFGRPSPGPPPGAALNITPGFAYPNPNAPSRGPSPLPPPQGSSWSPWNVPQSNSPPSFSQPLPASNAAARPRQPSYPSAYSQQQSLSPQPQPGYASPPIGHAYSPPAQHTRTYSEVPYSNSQPAYISPRQSRPMSSAVDSLGPAMAGMGISQPLRQNSNPSPGIPGPPSLTAPLPTLTTLNAALPSIQNPNGNPASKLAWCRDVLSLVDRMQAASSSSSAAQPTGVADAPPPGPIDIADPVLAQLVQIAVPLVVQISNPQPTPPNPLPPYVAEAIYLRATFAASGNYPQFVQHNPRSAFRDYERAARSGIYAAWFRLGRDYETFGDFAHAKDCFERGMKNNNESCLYRLGMAHLMGQLSMPANPEVALPLLQRAATLATVEVPQPAYVYGLLLLNEFSHVAIPPHLFTPFIPPGSTRETEARRHLERAAYLNFAPAQYKLGHAYEFAQTPFPFDALLSVQYYSLASQQGEIEADMALSKWFLCGAEGSFDKDEALAFTFAEKAARKGLPSAEFAMGYYMEVGVGGPKDLDASCRWYQRAAEHGNADAQERLAALSQPTPQSLSRQEHENLAETTLVRKRTQAKQRSDARPDGPEQAPAPGGGRQQVMAHARKASLAYAPGPGQTAYPPPAGVAPGPGPGPGYAQPQGPPPPQQGSPPRQQGPPLQQQGPPLQQQGPPPQQYSPQARPPLQGGAGSVPAPAPASQPGRQFADRPRYGLTDPGANSARTQSPLRQGSGGSGGPAPAPAPVTPKPKGPQTFQEMGFQSAKLEEKECVIM